MNDPHGHSATPVISDQESVPLIVEGGYSGMRPTPKLVRNFRDAKTVYRNQFADAASYDSNFKDIQNFEPISTSQPGWTAILQTGRNDDAAYFLQTMELAADKVSERGLQQDTYSTKTKGREMAARRGMARSKSLSIGIGVPEGQSQTHEHGEANLNGGGASATTRHHEQAAAREASQGKFDAPFHLGRLLKKFPDRHTLRGRIATAQSQVSTSTSDPTLL